MLTAARFKVSSGFRYWRVVSRDSWFKGDKAVDGFAAEFGRDAEIALRGLDVLLAGEGLINPPVPLFPISLKPPSVKALRPVGLPCGRRLCRGRDAEAAGEIPQDASNGPLPGRVSTTSAPSGPPWPS